MNYVCLIKFLVIFHFLTNGTPIAIFHEETNLARGVVISSCSYFIWDGVFLAMYWGSKGTNYFDVSGTIHAIMCSVVYIVTLVRFLILMKFC